MNFPWEYIFWRLKLRLHSQIIWHILILGRGSLVTFVVTSLLLASYYPTLVQILKECKRRFVFLRHPLLRVFDKAVQVASRLRRYLSKRELLWRDGSLVPSLVVPFPRSFFSFRLRYTCRRGANGPRRNQLVPNPPIGSPAHTNTCTSQECCKILSALKGSINPLDTITMPGSTSNRWAINFLCDNNWLDSNREKPVIKYDKPIFQFCTKYSTAN